MATTAQITLRNSIPSLAQWTVVTAFRPLHALVAAPALLFLATLTIMLFRPPDLQFYWLDRIAFLLLLFVVFLRECWLYAGGRLSLPPQCGPWQDCCYWDWAACWLSP